MVAGLLEPYLLLLGPTVLHATQQQLLPAATSGSSSSGRSRPGARSSSVSSCGYPTELLQTYGLMLSSLLFEGEEGGPGLPSH